MQNLQVRYHPGLVNLVWHQQPVLGSLSGAVAAARQLLLRSLPRERDEAVRGARRLLRAPNDTRAGTGLAWHYPWRMGHAC